MKEGFSFHAEAEKLQVDEEKDSGEQKEEKQKKTQVTFLQTETHIYEEIVRNGFATFLSYRLSDGFISEEKEIEYRGSLYIPAFTPDIVGYIPLPSETKDYGTQQDLIDHLKSFIRKWAVVDEDYLTLICYYILFAWVFDAFFEVPYLRILADLGSGKTRLGVHVLGQLLYKPIAITAASSLPSIFRILEKVRGTLIVDEADLDNSDKNSEFVQVINSGYTKNGVVLRVVGIGEKMHSYPFSVFGPKVFISREHFKDHALESRCLPITMKEARDVTNISVLLKQSLYTEGLELRNKLLLWRFRMLPTVGESIDMSYMELDVSTRFKQLFLLLSAVVSGESKEMLRKYAMKIQAESVERRKETVEGEIIEYLYQNRTKAEITCGEIADYFNKERSKKDEKDPRSIGWYIRERLGLKTYKITSGENKNSRGVKIESGQIEELARKYGIAEEKTTNQEMTF